MRFRPAREHAGRCLPVLLPVHELRRASSPEAGRLLRLLLVRLGEVPAEAGGRFLLRLSA